MLDFFIGIRLPQELEEICERYRRLFKAPRTVAHITLIPPFSWEKDREELKSVLQKAAHSTAPFQISGSGLGSFDSSVLFINVTLTKELSELQRDLAAGLAAEGISKDKRPYHPHITLATRLNRGQFELYQKQLQDFKPDYAFCCREITLFQFTDKRSWQDCAKIHLHA